MTKKHYEAIASAIKWNNPEDLPYALADYFAQENPKFQRERFLQACGITT